MAETVIVGAIVAAAAIFLVYRYVIKKNPGCSCGCGSDDCKVPHKTTGSCCCSDNKKE
jgi:hypothetical protein